MMGRAGIDEISLTTLIERDDADAAEGRGNVVYFELFGGRWWVAGLAAAASRGGMIIRDLHQTQRALWPPHRHARLLFGRCGRCRSLCPLESGDGRNCRPQPRHCFGRSGKIGEVDRATPGTSNWHGSGGGGRSVDARGCRDQCGCRMRRRGGRGLGFLEISATP